MSFFTSMAQNHLDRKRLKQVIEELELMERVERFAVVTDDGRKMIAALKEERYVLVGRLSPPIYM